MQARETHRWDGQKAKSRFLSIFFLGIYNVEMHQNLYPFQSSMDAQRILCKRFQLVGFQSTGQNRQISALSRFSIAKKRNWTLGRFFFGGHPQTKSSKVTRGFYGLPAPARTLLGDAAERVGVQGGPKVGRLMGGVFFLFVFKIVWFIQLDLIRVSGFLSILTKYQSESSPSDGITCIFCSHQVDLRQWHPPLWSSQATEKYAQVAWLKH